MWGYIVDQTVGALLLMTSWSVKVVSYVGVFFEET